MKEFETIFNNFKILLNFIVEIDEKAKETIFSGEYLEPIQILRRQLFPSNDALKRNSPILQAATIKAASSDSLNGGVLFQLPRRKSFTPKSNGKSYSSSSSFPSGPSKK